MIEIMNLKKIKLNIDLGKCHNSQENHLSIKDQINIKMIHILDILNFNNLTIHHKWDSQIIIQITWINIKWLKMIIWDLHKDIDHKIICLHKDIDHKKICLLDICLLIICNKDKCLLVIDFQEICLLIICLLVKCHQGKCHLDIDHKKIYLQVIICIHMVLRVIWVIKIWWILKKD